MAASTWVYGKYVYIPCNEYPHEQEIERVAYADFIKLVAEEKIDTVYMQNNQPSIYYSQKDNSKTIK